MKRINNAEESHLDNRVYGAFADLYNSTLILQLISSGKFDLEHSVKTFIAAKLNTPKLIFFKHYVVNTIKNALIWDLKKYI